MTHLTTNRWIDKRTDETKEVEAALKSAGFDQVDAYRYNPASIRVRVIDRRFEDRSMQDRDSMVEPFLEELPEQTQSDIINLFTFSPSELELTEKTLKRFLLNAEFEDPSPSIL